MDVTSPGIGTRHVAAFAPARRPAALIEGQWKGMAPRDEYAEIYDHLPLFGGRQDYEIGELIRSLGYSSVTTEPLMEPELWLETPTYPRYLVLAHS